MLTLQVQEQVHLLILNSTYYFVLHKGDSKWLKMTFLVITALFLLTYYSFYDVDNILMNEDGECRPK